jgi:hypothetical protein
MKAAFSVLALAMLAAGCTASSADAPDESNADSALMATSVIAGGQNHPRHLAQDATRIYWTTGEDGSGTVASVAKTGGVPTVLASGLRNPAGIAVHGDAVYWVERGPSFSGGEKSGAVKKVAKTGGAVSELASGQPDLDSIVVDADGIYFGGDGGLYKLEGGVVATLYVPTAPALHTASVPVLVADGATLYFTTLLGKGPIVRLPKAGGASKVLADAQATSALALDATHLYWGTDEGVFRVAKAGGVAQKLSAGAPSITAIAVDGEDVFFTDFQSDGVYRVGIASGTKTRLAVWSKPVGLLTDAAGLYWSYENELLGRMAPEPIRGSGGIARGRR